MEECTIKALMVLDTVTVDGVKVIQIPFEDILRGKIGIRINQPNLASAPVEVPPVLKVVEPPVRPSVQKEIVMTIPTEIKQLYQNQDDKMIQDVADYLKEVAKCWEYKNLGFQSSLLKKAAKAKPALNTIICRMYGKEGDQYLTELVTNNFDFIKQCWAESSN